MGDDAEGGRRERDRKTRIIASTSYVYMYCGMLVVTAVLIIHCEYT